MAQGGSSAAGRVTVYSVTGCPRCLQAKSTLHKLGLPVCDVDVNQHAAVRARVRELTGCTAVPQIFFNGVHVGGNEDLQKMPPEELQRLVLLVQEKPAPPDAPPLPEERISHTAGTGDGASELSEVLRNVILKLYADHLSTDGKRVDYKAMSQNSSFRRYCELAVQLQRVELMSLGREERLAFFINIYNSLVIHGNLRLGFPKNVWQRYRLALPDPEPLIHFALNCGAKGCPPIKTYTPQGIDSQLRTAAEAFLGNDDGCVLDPGRGEVKLSRIFKWYKVDFGGTDEKLLVWVLDHMAESPKKSCLQSLLSAGNVRLSFLPYDWSTNCSH
ncbi:uncharacterized protein LOC114796533 isoform X2 [Denticeps clupeoides]|uniref:uncharacterized protein LOC114796533 isoform X2 n=1 Tax=Denticeps clupeoides TaxID=299321 RepID=UPI0010A41D3F|nr:uncharacterized protein LOC114796533 isoform X2 [Denticeps clupeoides]